MASSTPSRRSLGIVLAGAALALALVHVGTARAADPAEERARAEFKKGKTAYDLGRFEDALTAYSAAYELKPLPAFLFNMAQCHKQLGRWERAVFFYKRYLDLAPTARDAGTARKLLQESEARLAEQRRKEDEEAQAKRLEEQKAREVMATQPRPGEAGLLPPPPPQLPQEESHPVYKQWWFWTGVAVVAAGAGAAAYFTTRPQPSVTSLGTINAR